VIHLDSLYWRAGWVEPAKDEWKAIVEEVLKRDSWILDGNYSGTLAMRYEACDTVILLDRAPLICLWRVIKRAVKYRQKRRPDMAEGCPERLTGEFLAWIWNYRKRTRPKVVRLMEENRQNKRVICLRSDAELERFLAQT
jgi:adenylate kinase family enzyme